MTERQLKSVVLIPKVTGGLSIIGSTLICADIVMKGRTKLTTSVYHRLLLVMSVMDICLSFTFFLSTWPIPKDTPGAPWLAAGTDATCIAQGFGMHCFTAAMFYNAYLSIYYVLLIVYNWPESRIVYWEYMVHGVTFLWCIVTSFTALALDMYGSNFLVWCFIEGWERSLALNIAWQWAAFATVLIMMIFLCWKIRQQFQTQNKYGESSLVINSSIAAAGGNASTDNLQDDHNNNNHETATTTTTPSFKPKPSKRRRRGHQQRRRRLGMVETQAALYCMASLLTGSSNVLISIFYYSSDPVGNIPFWVLQYGVATLPLQGFWNCLIYFRPKYLHYWEKKKKKKRKNQQSSLAITSSVVANRTAAATSSSGNQATGAPIVTEDHDDEGQGH